MQTHIFSESRVKNHLEPTVSVSTVEAFQRRVPWPLASDTPTNSDPLDFPPLTPSECQSLLKL